MDAAKYYQSKEERIESTRDDSVEHHQRHHDQHDQHHHMEDHSTSHEEKLTHHIWPHFLNKKIFLIAAFLIILAIGIYMRLGLIGDQGLFEPDGFYYYTLIRATLNNHIIEPQYLGLSGFPNHNPVGEEPGLPYLTVIFYLLIGWSGIGYIDVMRLLPVFFGLIEMALAYLIIRQFSKSKFLGLLAMFFIGVSSGNVARTAALVYRGDSFVSVPLMIALYLIILGFKEQRIKPTIIYALLSGFALSLAALLWTGSPFVIAIYMLAMIFLIFYSFIKGSKELSRKTLIFVTALLFSFILQSAYIGIGAARSGVLFQGSDFLVFYIPVLALSILTFYIIDKSVSIFANRLTRTIFISVLALAALGLLTLFFSGYIQMVASTVGVQTVQTQTLSHAIGQTTQELQKPSYPFLFASFGLQLFLAPIGCILFILLGGLIDNEKEMSGARTSAMIPFLILFTYLLIASFLQYNAIRYNALLSIPIALFAAYGLYGVMKLCAKVHIKRGWLIIVAALAIFIISIYLLFQIYAITSSGLNAKNLLVIVEGILMAAITIYLIFDTFVSTVRKSVRLRNLALVLFGIILIFSFVYSSIQSFGSVQADGINNQFLSAMTWLKNNTATNAKILALWPDGSVVEGWGNRTSYMDSVGGENSIKIYHFARFLVNNTADSQYLYNISKPDYLVTRQYWMVELAGLISEGLSDSAQYYYELLQPTRILPTNSTTTLYMFSTSFGCSQSSTGVCYNNVTVVGRTVSNGTIYQGYLSGTALPISPMKRIVFYNSSNYMYRELTANTVGSLNYTFLVFYTANRISGGLLLTNQLYDSVLFKTVYLCNSLQCPYNTGAGSGNATLRLVYANNDTRIFHINYTK